MLRLFFSLSLLSVLALGTAGCDSEESLQKENQELLAAKAIDQDAKQESP